MPATLHVCTTCRAGQPVPEGEACPGAQLFARLSDGAEGVRVLPVSCLSACDNGCSIALSAPGAWGYVYGHMTLDDAADILQGAARYAATPDGLVPWRERPVIFRKRALARIPPLSLQEAAE